MRALPVLLLLALVVLPGAAALSADVHDTDPGLSPSFALFPAHEEVAASMARFAGHPWVTLHELGTSGEGRPILLAEVTDPTSDVPLDARVVTFLFTQQHGNEPAGTPAALSILEEITSGGPLAERLGNQVLLLLPMANPDGASANQRANAADVDINRDHIALVTPEARILHSVLTRWDVHVAMDHHEYSGIGAGQPVPVRVYDADLTTLFPVHGNVVGPTSDAARRLMYEGVWPYAKERGFTVNEYGEVTAAGVPVQRLAGGPDPGIERNHLGLHHVAGLLVETRVDGFDNPFQDAERRTAIHRAVMEATLIFAQDEADWLREAKARSMAQTLAFPDTLYREGEEHTARMGDAVVTRDAADLNEVLALHGIPAGALDGASRLHGLGHALRGHAAAALHPASSRALDANAQVVALADAGEALDTNKAASGESIPSLGLLALIGLMAIAAHTSRARRQR